ncbi:transcription factor IIIB 60 kDa subunit-like isoform X2 [Coffea eugenioides]|uniref:transcription factor IIIB 60 kDa subunit-like isoform X2 n=1 Tax=Coffea eugenioides TaxID=49369 RepID=UPI000F61185F|nr:transcription factor IIIB 60 kDa subunit-like isoform X2 [Coffea eugenioides]
MVWCPNCVRDCRVDRDHASGYICCSECGRIHYQDVFTDEPTFVKGPGGESRLAGSFVRSIQSDCSESFKRTLENGSRQINDLMIKLDIPDESLGAQAASFYRIAVERSFTKGRRTAHVAAACLYIACRANDKPYLLIDFSIWLSVNVYVLGAVYLQLCKVLNLEEHPFVQKPIDPSLFMHRFTSALMKGDYKNKVWKTALQIVASMKRDWMQTGRKPSGICGAALYISALSHGCSYSKSEIVKIVHICEATLTKRLVEFENTKSGSLTIEEFNQNAEEFEKENHSSTSPDVYLQESGKKEVLCQHKGKEPHFAHGLCSSCYKDFIELSGGLDEGCEPPAFQVAERDRLARASAEKEGSTDQANQDSCNHEKEAVPVSASASAPQNLNKGCDDTFSKDDDIPSVTDETDNLSDIDDVEVNSYLNSKEESHYKKIIWEQMNKEYVKEQAAKEAAAALRDCGEVTDDVLAARKLAAAAAAAVAKSRDQQKLKRAESKNAGPAPTAAEATRQMLMKKGLSSKINYDVLEKLFDESCRTWGKNGDKAVWIEVELLSRCRITYM